MLSLTITGQCLAVDFERNLYTEGMAILEHHLKPMHSLPGVVLEQSYINKMAEGLQPLARLASKTGIKQPLSDHSSIYFHPSQNL